MSSQSRYTLFGVIAVLLWSCLVAFARGVAEHLGAVGGAASMYTVASLMLLVVVGMPDWRKISWRYVLIGGALFAAYEVCLSLSLGFANNRLQAIEVSVVNYLWPALTVLMAVLLSGRKTSLLLYPAIMVAFLGVVVAIGGDNGLSINSMAKNVASNPLVYTLAFTGAFLWAAYCNFTQRQRSKQNAITPFFMLTALVLWIKYAITDTPPMEWSPAAFGYLFAAGSVIAGGYGLWNIAIMRGNMVLLATLSYFTPVFSTLFSALFLQVSLPASFVPGVIMVTLGSLMCWRLTRNKPASTTQAADQNT